LQQLHEQSNQLHTIEATVDNVLFLLLLQFGHIDSTVDDVDLLYHMQLAADIKGANKQADDLTKGWFGRLTAFKTAKKKKREQG
jgi:hypothetical protein